MENLHNHQNGTRSGRKNQKTLFNSFLWHNSIPFTASFLFWRALKGKLPTNEKIITFCEESPNYFCCSNRQGLDTIEHIQNNGQFVDYIWQSVAAVAGVTLNHSSLKHLLIQWWNTKHKNGAHKLLLQATSIFICRNRWKNRCASRFGGTSSNISKVKYAIYKDTYRLLVETFTQIKWPST